MRFFTDNHVPLQVARILDAYDPGITVQHLTDKFDANTNDTVWIPEVASWKPRPFVICGDGHILTRPDEAVKLRESGLTWFVLKSGWTNQKFRDWKWRAPKAFGLIVEEAARLSRPTIFKVPIGATSVERIGATRDHAARRHKRR